MADENIVTNIVANADFSGLIADVNKVAASLSKLQAQIIQSDARLASQVATMNRSFGENLRQTGQFSSHFVTLTSDVEKFGKNLDGGKLKLGQYFRAFQDHTKSTGGLIRDLAKQQVALQNAIVQPMGKNAQGLMQYSVHIPQGLDAVKNKTALAKQELQIMNKVIQDGGVQLINWGKNTQWAGRQLTVGLTVPLAAFGKAAADAFRMADAELTRLTKVYGGVAATSAAELGKIKDQVTATAAEISKAYGVSFKDTITLAADIAATGKQGNDLLNSVKETSRLAVLGEVDRQDAMKATLAIQTTFKQNTEQLSESINFLNSVENQTSTSLADLVEAIPKAGPVMQGLGGDVKDLALFLTAMKEGGINASEGANALKSALASLINPTKVAKEKFSEMGIDLGGIVAKNAGNLTETVFALQAALDNLDPLQKQQAIEQLFGKFQFARLNALFANLGKQGSQTLQVMDLMKASSQELADVAGRELSMVTESASGKYKRAVEGLKADLAGIGEEFLKIQTFFINVVDGIIKFINKLPDPIKSLLTFVTGFTAIIGPVIMLTGVLANFFGYIIKGASHFKSLFKGGEGWKMLTPEIMAANKAGSLIESTFYSDAKAATVLKTAIAGLITEFEILQSKASTGAISVAPAMSTMAGNLVQPGGGGRVVNPNHPLISPEDTRSMSHLNPVAGMTADQKATQTIFGVVPGAPKVNQKIGNNPQMYMSGDLPKIPGLTSIGGASTGIVAEEAAKWHAMTGALAMQSQSEIEMLKKEVGMTGLITAELSDSYQALLPTMTKLTANAAKESALIVAELQAGKITVDQARAKIIQLNAQVESMIAQASVDIAGQQGRSIGLTTVPLLNQPVVNADGKTNMKELTRPGRTRDLLNKIARGLGVKTFGAGYSTETTIPKRFATGNLVPGSGSSDTVPALLTPGEFVVNKKATAAALPILEAINSGEFSSLGTLVSGVRKVGERSSRVAYEPGAVNYDQMQGRAGRNSFWDSPSMQAGRPGPDEVVGHLYTNDFYNRIGTPEGTGSSPRLDRDSLKSITGLSPRSSASRFDVLPNNFMTIGSDFNTALGKNAATAQAWMASARKPEHLLSLINYLTSKGATPQEAKAIAQKTLDRINRNISRISGPISERMFGNIVTNSSRAELNLISRPFGRSPSIPQGPNKNAAKFPNQFLTQAHSSSFVGMPLVRRASGFGRLMDTINTLNANNPKPFMPRGRYTPGAYMGFNRRNKGGIIGMNDGGMVPGYEDGGIVRSAMRGARSEGFVGQGAFNAARAGGLSSPMAGMGIGMGMQGAGAMMGGQAGTILQVASILPMISMTPITKLIKGITGIGGALKTAGGAAKIFEMILKNAFKVGPILLVTAAITGVVMLFKKWRTEVAENAKEQTMLNGITEKGAVEAGIKYNNLSDSIKGVKEQMELFRASQLTAFNSQNTSGITGLTLTIKELQDKIKAAKTDMPEFVSSLDSLSKSAKDNKGATIDMAANWKAQFVAGGMSVAEATNEIYAIIKASDMANNAFAAISNTGFTSIKDKGSAVSYMFKEMGKNLDKLSGPDLGNSLSNVVIGIDSARQALVGTRDANGEIIDQQRALEITMKKLTDSAATNKTLTNDQIESLKKTHPELAKILNSTDTVRSTYSKWRVLLAGINVDLKTVSANQAEALSKFVDLQNAAIAQAEKAKPGQKGYIASIAQSSALIEKLNKQILAGGQIGQKAAERTKDQINAEIKAIDKRIKKIQEEADARIKAIQKTQSAESYAVQLKQAQLDLQSAIASGDKEAQVRAQLALSGLQKQRESEMAIAAIQDDAAAKQKIEQARKDKLQDELDALGKRVAAAQSKAADVTIVRDKVVGYQAQREALLARESTNSQRDPKSKEAIEEAKNISRDFAVLANAVAGDAKGKDAALAKAIKEAFVGVLINDRGDSIGGKMVGNVAPKGKPTWQEGTGLATLKTDASAITAKIDISNKLLAEIKAALGGGGGLEIKDIYTGKKNARYGGGAGPFANLPGGKNRDLTDPAGDLTGEGIVAAIKDNSFKKGDKFTFNGRTYKVVDASAMEQYKYPTKLYADVVKKALGGPFSAGQKLMVNDRINPLGAQKEGMVIRPNFSGTIYPNAATMPRYDIPSGAYSGYRNTSSVSSKGSAPVINNYITASPNMDIKQLAREVGQVTAKAVSRGGNNRGYSNGTQQVVNI